MPVFDENGKQISGDDDFPKLRDLEDATVGGKKKSFTKKMPVVPIILGVVVVILLIVVVLLATKVNYLSQEVTALSNVKKELVVSQSKLGSANIENEKLKADLKQIQGELETVKTQKAELDDQIQKLQAAASKKKPAITPAAKKPNGPKKN